MTKIEWARNKDGSAGKTWNPVGGCSRVSPGCEKCYAMRFEHRFSGPGQRSEGLTIYRDKSSRRPGVDWSGVVRFLPERLKVPIGVKKPTTWFVNSTSDLFHEKLTKEQIAAVFGVMAACPHHTFQVLTKRAKRMRHWFEWFEQGGGRHDSADVAITAALGVPELNRFLEPREVIYDDEIGPWDHLIEEPPDWPLANVWLGVSAEDQQRADERIPELMRTPASIRFVSAEPLLGPIDLSEWLQGTNSQCAEWCGGCGPVVYLDWVIPGGESGPGARPCEVAWIRALTEQCASADVPIFNKQLGAKPLYPDPDICLCGSHNALLKLKHRKGADMSEWPEDLQVREMPR